MCATHYFLMYRILLHVPYNYHRPNSPPAVSYTHLDVYKRQVILIINNLEAVRIYPAAAPAGKTVEKSRWYHLKQLFHLCSFSSFVLPQLSAFYFCNGFWPAAKPFLFETLLFYQNFIIGTFLLQDSFWSVSYSVSCSDSSSCSFRSAVHLPCSPVRPLLLR